MDGVRSAYETFARNKIVFDRRAFFARLSYCGDKAPSLRIK